jgi:hypothetical protein
MEFQVICLCGWKGECPATKYGVKKAPRTVIVFARKYLMKQLSDHIYGRNTEKPCRIFKGSKRRSKKSGLS